MAEEILEQGQQDLPEVNYAEQIQKLKNTTVSREQYDKMVAENNKLLDALVSGEIITKEGAKPEKPRTEEINDLYNDLFVKGEPNNLKFHEKMYRLSDLIEEETGYNPCLPWGYNGVKPSQDDIVKAQRDREATEALMEYAAGDSQIFTDQLQLKTVDTLPGVANARRR